MSELDRYQREAWGEGRYEPAGWFERLLWFAAGANAKLLERCPNSDRVKYQGLGGVVWATALLAFFSGSYALYAVFSPKVDTALETSTHWPSVIGSVIGGLVWSAIILNLDRFIVSSAGKGDGTEKITASEFGNAFPRMVMAFIIGICISAPLEIRVLKPEIDQQLALEQQEHKAALRKQKEAEFEASKAEDTAHVKELEAKVAAARIEQERRRQEIENKRSKLEEEMAGRGATGKAGEGPTVTLLRDSLRELEDSKALFDAQLLNEEKAAATAIADLHKRIAKAADEFAALDAAYEKQAKSLDGLLRRIQISHQIGGNVPYAIMFMLLAIELGPIFFKMMLTRGVYDYLEENEKKLRQAYQGVFVETNLIKGEGEDARSITEQKERFLRVERVIAEEKERHEAELALAKIAYQEFKAVQAAEVALEPRKYLRVENDNKG